MSEDDGARGSENRERSANPEFLLQPGAVPGPQMPEVGGCPLPGRHVDGRPTGGRGTHRAPPPKMKGSVGPLVTRSPVKGGRI